MALCHERLLRWQSLPTTISGLSKEALAVSGFSHLSIKKTAFGQSFLFVKSIGGFTTHNVRIKVPILGVFLKLI